ncbi:hypothetical protein ACROYT_G028195 [Oculina patagonica]
MMFLFRSADFQQKKHLSSSAICYYISKFKHSLQELNLQECYWLKGDALSTALQKCRKLTSLNVMGCSVTKEALCSVLKQNGNLKTLAWSIYSPSDLYLPPRRVSRETFRELLETFCNGLATAFTGLDQLTIRFPVIFRKFKIYLDFGMPVICSKLCLKRFVLQWFDVADKAIQCVKIVIEGSGFQFPQTELTTFFSNSTPFNHHLTSLQAMSLKTAGSETLRTFVLPNFISKLSDNCDEHIKKLATKSTIVNMDLGVLGLQEPDRLMSILSAQQSLRYLNLTGMDITGHMLQVIATSSPKLEFLNLRDCRECLTPIKGLETLALCCTNLAHLNLKGVHYGQDCGERLNNVMEIISKFTSLVSLSLCNCVLGSNGTNKTSEQSLDEDLHKRKRKSLRGCQSSEKIATSSASTSAADDLQTPCDELSCVRTFDYLTQACSKITEFELIRSASQGINFVKGYYELRNRLRVGVRFQAEECIGICHTIRSSYDTLLSIANWKSLQRLTLAAPLMQGSLECLVTIARNCPNLQFLSLATLSNLNHSGNVALLQEALSCCHQLRDLRLEQPYLKITESFVLSLGESKHLERVCIIAREGPMKIDSPVVISLFKKCHELFYFQVLCDISSKDSKMMMASVEKRFVEVRPGLIVSVVPFCQASIPNTCQVEIVKTVPVVHLKELFLFGTSVATSVPT